MQKTKKRMNSNTVCGTDPLLICLCRGGWDTLGFPHPHQNLKKLADWHIIILCLLVLVLFSKNALYSFTHATYNYTPHPSLHMLHIIIPPPLFTHATYNYTPHPSLVNNNLSTWSTIEMLLNLVHQL